MMSWRSLASGFAGAVALTAAHEFGRSRLPNAPRMDVVGMRALRRFVPALRYERPRSTRLRRLALIGDLIANTLYYSGVDAPSSRQTWRRAGTLGFAAGVSAITVPPALGLDKEPRAQHRASQLMTIAWYVAGAVAAATEANGIGRK